MAFYCSLDELKQSRRNVLVVGLGISGIESAKFLVRFGLRVVICERQGEQAFLQRSKYATAVSELLRSGVAVYFGIDGEAVLPLLVDVGLAVVSPGVPLDSGLVGAIKSRGIPYVSELELGIELHGGRSIVVTGSNGKTTTVSLLDHVLRHGGLDSHLCGNVGTPVISNHEILDSNSSKRAILVVEASSYQLESCTVLKPNISILLNISENHLERHGTMERYAAAKARALTLQDESDYMIVNADDPMVLSHAREARGTRAVFGQQSESELASLADDWVQVSPQPLLRASVNGAIEEYDMTACHLLGLHNRYNIAAVILAARRMGLSSDAVQVGLASFYPLEHRLEPVPSSHHWKVFNDSKSTTVASAVAAFQTVRTHYPSNQVVVMIGGLSKAGSWDPLMLILRECAAQVLSVVCFGKDGAMLAGHCKAAGVPARIASSLRDGTQSAVSLVRASSDAIVLLTPGCASFDEFTDFEHRGREFKRYVQELEATAGA
jgi:UDP-N-acetylmuramoylalanine--D-glutamate ligase